MKFQLGLAFKSTITALSILFLSALCQAQTISRDMLTETLQKGGFVIVMRHASSPRQLPDAASANPDNPNRERQLDDKGRRDAGAMGEALRRLMIPFATVLSSPAYRAMETARLMGFTEITPAEELSNEGMQTAGENNAAWLKQQVVQPVEGSNRLLITHAPNMTAAFPQYSEEMSEGEALIFEPHGTEAAIMIQRIGIDEWSEL